MSSTYNITTGKSGGLWITLQPAHIADQLRFAKEKGVTNFSCMFHPTDKIEIFPSFEGIPVTGLFIGSLAGIKDTASLNDLGHLQMLKLHFEGPVTSLDFSKLTSIEQLEITYNNKVKGLSSLVNLKDLRLFKYKPATKDLEACKGFQKIAKIKLLQPVVTSLDGIQALDQLLELEVFKPKGFTTFFTNTSQKSLTGLQQLDLEGCKELDFGSLPVIEGLQRLRIANCGNQIDNLDFIGTKFPHLQSLIFVDSETKDGNLDVLVKHPVLERVTIDHKKHYSLKEKEINAALAARRNANKVD